MKKRKKKRKLLKILILIAVLLLAAGALLWLRMRGGNRESALSANVRVQDVTRGTIRITTEGNGSIEAADERPVEAKYTLKIGTVEAENGDVVREGDVIATVDRDSVKAQISQLESSLSDLNAAIRSADRSGSSSLTSPIAGRVRRIFVHEGDLLTDVTAEYGGVMELSVDGKLKVEITPKTDLDLGDTVTVSFLSYEEEGTVFSEEDGVYTVTIEDDPDYLVDMEATVTDEDGAVLGTGYLKSNHPYLVECAYGIADELNVGVGDSVDSGTTLLTRTYNRYNSSYLTLLDEREELMEQLQELRMLERTPQICAEGNGILSQLALQDGTVIAEDTPMYHLISTEHFWLKTPIDELDIAKVSEGQVAKIVFDAFDDEEYEGKVEKISALGENVGGVTKYTVTISVPGIEKVRTAMSATATIVIEEKDDVLLVPVDAVQTVDGQKCVTVVRADGQETVPVTLGLVNNTEAEVIEGLSEGDQVAVMGKSDFELMMDMMQQGRSQFAGGEG